MAKNKWIFPLLVFLILVVLGNVFLPVGDYPRKYPRSFVYDYAGYDLGFFMIDPETILVSLNEGQSNVFLPEERDHVQIEQKVWFGPILYDLPAPWYQADYLLIANTLNRFVFQETLEDWRLYRIGLHARCGKAPNGFRSAEFTFFKPDWFMGNLRYTTRWFNIQPEYLSVAWGDGALFPRPLRGWKSMDLSKIKISAEDALRIAEEDGGSDVFPDVNCTALVELIPEIYGGWYVSSGSYGILIDPYTGEIIR